MITKEVIGEILQHYVVSFHNNKGMLIRSNLKDITTIKVLSFRGDPPLKNPIILKLETYVDFTFSLFLQHLSEHQTNNMFGVLVDKIKHDVENLFKTKSILVESKSYGVSLKFPRKNDKRVNFIEQLLTDIGFDFKMELSQGKQVYRFKIPKKLHNINVLDTLGETEKITIFIN